MSSVIAKMHVSSITLNPGKGGKVNLNCVSRGSANASFSAASPSGNIEMSCDDSELQFFLDLRSNAIAATARNQKDLELHSTAWHKAGRSPEVLVLIGRREPRPVAVNRSMFVSKITPETHAEREAARQGSVDLQNDGTEPWIQFRMHVSNPSAYIWFAQSFDAGQEPFDVQIYPANEGWPGDGHVYVDSGLPATHYLHDKCAECGWPETDH